jgi:hypothetical protein
VVKLTGDQTVAGKKTFSTSPVVPSKSAAAGNNPTVIATEAQVKAVADSVAAKAPLASPTFTGTPKVPNKTSAAENDGTLIATQAQVFQADRRVVSNGSNINPDTNAADLTMQQGSSIPGGPTDDWCSYLTLRHANAGGWFRQLAFDFYRNDIYTRYKAGGGLGSWDKLAFTNNPVFTGEPKIVNKDRPDEANHIAVVWSSSSSNDTVAPIGAYISTVDGDIGTRNADAVIYLGDRVYHYRTVNVSKGVMSGTWRHCGSNADTLWRRVI